MYLSKIVYYVYETHTLTELWVPAIMLRVYLSI